MAEDMKYTMDRETLKGQFEKVKDKGWLRYNKQSNDTDV